MPTKTIGGISGVLGELISPATPAIGSGELEEMQGPTREVDSTGCSESPSASRCQRARMGRPPDSSVRSTGPKEKVTLRLPSDLIREYRDWSWEARCQLSELVEQALTKYRDSSRKSRRHPTADTADG